LTGGKVTSIHQVARLKAWLTQQGCSAATLDKRAIEKLLAADDLPTTARRALELRQAGAQAAAKKIDALLARCDRDSRIRGALRYHGASTGRWSGNGVQPQNLKRPQIEDVDAAVAAVATGNYAYVRSLYLKPLSIIGDITRSVICAKPGYQLIGADFASVESRALAWICDEKWKLEIYRRFDATHDPRDEPYCITACRILRVPDGTFNAESPERKVGKTCDLAFGYQGGLKAFRKFEPERFRDEEVEQFKQEWRASHPRIKSAYGGLWTENIVSAISRDLLSAALIRVERAGYRVVLHVHDEIICEVPIRFGSTEEFSKLMTVSPSWAHGLPIAAKAWCGPRFCKS
jgi:DNA polymerase bacteriophage-type